MTDLQAPQRRTESEFQRLGRTHAVLSRCNRSLARALDERGLLDACCTHLVEVGGYGFAWVGYLGRKRPPWVRLVAHAGQGHGDFSAAALAGANAADRPSACRLAIATGRPVVLRDLLAESHLAPWAAAARRCGYRAMIALPLQADGAPYGNLSIFSGTREAFDAPEAALLAELADDLAFGIQTLRARAAQAQAVRRLRDEVEREARRRIAATLHDGVGQTMQAVNLGLKRVRAMAEQQVPVPVALLDQLIGGTGEAIRELRTLSHELRPPGLERQPLLDAVRCHCSEAGQRTGIAIDVLADAVRFELDEPVKEQLFLGFREALSNALRHAAASHIEIVLKVHPQERLSLAVIDDGIGFDTRRTFERPAGLGLGMIRERAEGVRGRAHIRSTPGRGTLVRICVPLAKEDRPCRT